MRGRRSIWDERAAALAMQSVRRARREGRLWARDGGTHTLHGPAEPRARIPPVAEAIATVTEVPPPSAHRKSSGKTSDGIEGDGATGKGRESAESGWGEGRRSDTTHWNCEASSHAEKCAGLADSPLYCAVREPSGRASEAQTGASAAARSAYAALSGGDLKLLPG